eukprot:CCRYP_009916-RA/>CCRYP_009916-RA protein AED:0.68 eAED:0.37 QI:0/0/0/1/1/1/2/0/308
MLYPSFRWEWRPSSMINPTDARPTLNTAPKDGSLARPLNTTANHTHVIQHNAKAKHVGAKNLQDLQCLQQLFSDTAKQQVIALAPPKPVTSHAPPPSVLTSTPLPTLIVSDDEDSDDKLEPPPRVPTHRLVPSMPRPQPTTTPPALNTRSRASSITHEAMLHILATRHIGITADQATQQCFPTDMLHAVLNDETAELMEYRHLVSNPKYRDTWKNAYGKELGQLAQGLPGIVKGANTIVFIHKTNVPQDRRKDVMYGHIVANFHPKNDDLYRTRLTVGGNHINFPGNCGMPTADMITVKILLNSVIST